MYFSFFFNLFILGQQVKAPQLCINRHAEIAGVHQKPFSALSELRVLLDFTLKRSGGNVLIEYKKKDNREREREREGGRERDGGTRHRTLRTEVFRYTADLVFTYVHKSSLSTWLTWYLLTVTRS